MLNIIVDGMGNMSKIERYNMINSRNSKRFKDLYGQDVAVDAYVMFEDGEDTVLAISVNGDVYATSSPTATRDFATIIEVFGKIHKIKVLCLMSKNGRQFTSIQPVD